MYHLESIYVLEAFLKQAENTNLLRKLQLFHKLHSIKLKLLTAIRIFFLQVN